MVFLAALALAAAALATAALAAEAPAPLWRTCEPGSGAGQCSFPTGIASDPETGHLYVADAGNSRINELTAWGEFVKAFGWGVVASGPDDKPQNEIQKVTVDATAGSFKLRSSNAFYPPSPPIPFDASAATVQAALAELAGGDQEGLTPGDVAVSGPAGGPWTIEFVGDRADTDMRQLSTDALGLSGGAATASVATVQDGASFEICVPANGDVCRAGQEGAQAGEFAGPQGVAVDSNGGVYVVDRENHRVQKFDREGHFVWMVGGDVNKTKVEEGGTEAQRNLCTAASGDVCQAGTEGAGNGQFGTWPFGAFITVGPDDTVYVGDQNRIQKLSPAGAYEGEIPFPGKTVQALAADPSTGQLYVSLSGEANVRKIGTGGEAVCTVEASGSIAADAAGRLYVTKGTTFQSLPATVVEAFNPDCTPDSEIAPFPFPGDERLNNSTNLATGSACFSSGGAVYVSNAAPDRPDGYFVSAYGPPPDKVGLCPPPPNPPGIEAEFAASVDTTEAQLKATINPRFWADTSYYLEYGAQPCSEGGCEQKPLPPGTSLGAGAVDTGVLRAVRLDSLSPHTTYHYRFLATSHCKAAAPEEECTTVGADRSFTTFAIPAPPGAGCENAASRIGFGGLLPDCRAYEMVSPVDKGGGAILVLINSLGDPAVLEQASDSGEKLAYGSYAAFGDAASVPYTSQYIAQRIAGSEWRTHGISPPRGKTLFFESDVEFKAFSPDLCEAWLITYAEGALGPGALAGVSNLYRRTDGLCSADAEAHYEALAPITEPDAPVNLELLDLSADGHHALFLTNAKLEPQGSAGVRQLYETTGGATPRLVCVLPDQTALSGPCAAGSQTPGGPTAGARAISADGSRVFWSPGTAGEARLYLRQNPEAPESARTHGAAAGKGNLIGPAAASGNVLAGSELVKKVHLESGGFAPGQQVSDSNGGIPPETTIVKVEEPAPATFTLTLSAKATKTKLGDSLSGAASATVPALISEAGAFEAGQEISAPGIPPATTVLSCAPACGPGATSLTLSTEASETKIGAALSATSPCTEAATKACTVPVSEAAEAAQGTRSQSWFWGAAADGSKAIFSTGELPSFGGGGSIGVGQATLYSFELEGEVTTPIATGVGGVLGISEDADRVYFASKEVLSGEEENSNGDKAQAGKANLYLYEAGEGGGSTKFIATLAGADMVAAVSNERFGKRRSRVSPDGAHAAFVSVAPLTGYDNKAGQSGNAFGQGYEPGDAMREIYLYDAAAKELRCASCNPSGARPAGPSAIPAFESGMHAARALADDGSRLYFGSADALAARDSNGAVDVYQWEQAGTGACTEASPTYSPQNGGCIDLLSSGQSHLDSRFVEASPSGDDVFFATASSLLPQDPGTADIYDARVNGGLPIPQGPAPGCEGEACQSPPAAPNDPTPASSAFEGAGNVHQSPAAKKKCRKGGVRRHRKCVKKAHRMKHAQKHKRHSRANRGRPGR